jgi:hypothetical protein
MAGNELGQVAPVRADVRERPRRPSQQFVHPPVGVVRPQEPILEVGAVKKANRSGLPAVDALAGFAHGWVVAVDEWNAGEQPRFGGKV